MNINIAVPTTSTHPRDNININTAVPTTGTHLRDNMNINMAVPTTGTHPRNDIHHIVSCCRLQWYNSVQTWRVSVPDTSTDSPVHTRCVINTVTNTGCTQTHPVKNVRSSSEICQQLIQIFMRPSSLDGGPHIASHSVCPSVCPSVPLSCPQYVPKSTDALSACRKVHVCHCNSLGGAT